MSKIFIFLCLLVVSGVALQAQNEKLRVAVFDPSSSGTNIDEGTKVAVRELISSTFVNTGKYNIVERSLLQQVMKEQAFSNTDVVDESQATELGRLAGANKVVLSVVTLVGGRNMLSIKTIDVKTATVDQQKTKIVSSNDLLDIVESLTLELLGEKASGPTILTSSQSQPQSQPQQRSQSQPQQRTVASSDNRANPNFDVASENFDGIEFIFVETMGKGFYIGKYEVTQTQWQTVMGKKNPSKNKGMNNPVESVSLNDILAFIKVLNKQTGKKYRLPTEDEWTYAANGGKNNESFEYAGSNNIFDVAWYNQNSGKRTHPVGTKNPNSLGIYDLTGNVWEWCSAGRGYILRGGSWMNDAKGCRLSARITGQNGSDYPHTGFRLVLE